MAERHQWMTGADRGEISGNQERPVQGPAQGLDPGRFVHCPSDDREVEARLGADVAVNDVAIMQGHAGLKR